MSTDWLGYFYDQAGYGDMLATAGLYGIYPDTDVRKGFIQRGRRGSDNPAYIIRKYTMKTDENVKLIRLSEIYLNRAEAYARLGQDANAIGDVNVVIGRADSDPASLVATGTTGTALIDAVLLERRKELAFEGHRLFDLLRNKKGFTKIRRGSVAIDVPFLLTSPFCRSAPRNGCERKPEGAAEPRLLIFELYISTRPVPALGPAFLIDVMVVSN